MCVNAGGRDHVSRLVFAQCSNCGANGAIANHGLYRCLKCRRVWTPTPTEARMATLATRLSRVPATQRAAYKQITRAAVATVTCLCLWIAIELFGHDVFGVGSAPLVLLAGLATASSMLVLLVLVVNYLQGQGWRAEVQRLLEQRRPYIPAGAPWKPPFDLTATSAPMPRKRARALRGTVAGRVVRSCWRLLGG
jgi:hypothetical protein